MKIVLPDIDLPKIEWPVIEIDWNQMQDDAQVYGIMLILGSLALFFMWKGCGKPVPIESVRGRKG